MYIGRKITGLLIAFLVFGMMVPQTAFALDEGDWTYEVNQDGGATITGYSGPAGDVTIPGQLDGYDVSAIGSDLFTAVAITSLSIPQSVRSIDSGAFWECKTLESISIEAGNPEYVSADGIIFSKDGTMLVHFPAAKSGSSYTIPDTVTTLGASAFDHNQNLQSIIIPESVTEIGPSAFWRCQSLTTLVIPATVALIGEAAFANCTSLTEFTVDSASAGYQSIDGILFDISGTALIQFPAGRMGSYTVPDGVTSLSPGSFRGCQLTEVVISDSVMGIGNCAFAYCDSFTTVSLGSGVQTIEYGAFQACGLTSVTLPASIASIGAMAFDSCGALQAAWFMGEMPEIDATAFQNTPAEFAVGYHTGREASWRGYADYPAEAFCVVSFDSQGGSAVPDQMAAAGAVLAAPAAPEYAGFAFGGWYTDAACSSKWDMNTDTVAEDMTLYARWTSVLTLSCSDEDGRILTGETLTITPNTEGGQWHFDEGALALSGNVFTALKAGTVTVSYTADGQTADYSITVEEAAPAAAASAPAAEEQAFPTALIIAVAAAVLIAVVLIVLLKKRGARSGKAN